MHGLVLRHAVAGADALADFGTELLFLRIGHLDVADLVGSLERAAELAELFRRSHGCNRQRGAQGESDQCSSIHAASPSFRAGTAPNPIGPGPAKMHSPRVPPLTIA